MLRGPDSNPEKRHKHPPRLLSPVLITLLTAAVVSAPLQTQQLTPQERRGKQVYTRGISPSGADITAVLGKEGISTPASIVACANCHGLDGSGKQEGGVRPPNITWEALTKPYGDTLSTGRNRVPYTESALKRAIALGIDSAGNQLHVAMPRYRMSYQDMADLIAYLRRVGKNLDPGLSDTTIRIGMVLMSGGRPGEMSRAAREALAAYFDETNRQGGIHGRQIELKSLDPPNTHEERAKAVRAFIEGQQIFALTASFMADADKEIAAVLGEDEVPLVGAFSLYPHLGSPPNRYAFYLYSGIEQQAAALAAFIVQRYKLRAPRAAIIRGDETGAREAADAIRKQCRQPGWNPITEILIERGEPGPGGVVERLKREETEVVFFLGESELCRSILKEADKLGINPTIMMPGSAAGGDIVGAPESFDGRLFLSFPTIPSDQTAEATAAYRRLAEAHHLSPDYVATQFVALSSAAVLVEGLKRSGRDVSREKLVGTLEGLYEFRTGFTPAVTYGPNRRVGAVGCYIVGVDLKARTFTRVGDWVEPK